MRESISKATKRKNGGNGRRRGMQEKADSELVRRQNRRIVLDALRRHGALARIELGRHTGLSPASITSISAQLIADGILQEVL